jgi:hypothetical protein
MLVEIQTEIKEIEEMGRKLADIRAQEKEHIAMEKSEMPGP